ncbi:MAG: type II secretion system protein J [bacterium]
MKLKYLSRKFHNVTEQSIIRNPQMAIDSGFTLVELLIVLAIISIINLAVVELFFIGQDTNQRGGQSLNRVGLARSAMNIINRDIRSSTQVLPVYYNYKSNESCLILKGKQTVVYTISNHILQRIEFSLSAKKTGVMLPLAKDIDTLRFNFDTADIEQVKLITVSFSCSQMKFMNKNEYTLTSVTKLRNK